MTAEEFSGGFELSLFQELEQRVRVLNLLLHRAYAAAGSATSHFEVIRSTRKF